MTCLQLTNKIQNEVPSNVVCLVFGSSCLMYGKKHILLDNIRSLPYSLCHWVHILYTSSRQSTLAIYTCQSVTSVPSVLFTNSYSLCQWQHILYSNSRQCTLAIYTCQSVTSVTFFLFTNTVLWYSYNYMQHITYGRKGIKLFSITEEEQHVNWAYIRFNQANC